MVGAQNNILYTQPHWLTRTEPTPSALAEVHEATGTGAAEWTAISWQIQFRSHPLSIPSPASSSCTAPGGHALLWWYLWGCALQPIDRGNRGAPLWVAQPARNRWTQWMSVWNVQQESGFDSKGRPVIILLSCILGATGEEELGDGVESADGINSQLDVYKLWRY